MSGVQEPSILVLCAFKGCGHGVAVPVDTNSVL